MNRLNETRELNLLGICTWNVNKAIVYYYYIWTGRSVVQRTDQGRAQVQEQVQLQVGEVPHRDIIIENIIK